jgi:putative ABC transport system ATP-binding protein
VIPTLTSQETFRSSTAAPSDRKVAIETRDLSRVVKGKTLVDNISVHVHEGEVLAIVGPSGAGKSSFLRLLNRLDEPTGGTVLLYDQDYRELAPRELRRRVGMVMQAAYLFPGTVADNLRFGPQQHGQDLAPSEIDALLEQVGLEGFASRDVLFLSGGEAQRVSLARTLANQPEVLLLDEPTSALDERTEREIESLLKFILSKEHLTALMITHDSAQAARVASRAILINGGRLMCDGTVAEVLHAESTLH